MPAEDASPIGHHNPLPPLAREVEDFVAAAGWDQPPQLFALVSTSELLARQPELGGQLDAGSELTPVAQESLPSGDLADALAAISWPATVTGCALAQEIVVLPPDAEDQVLAPGEDVERMRQVAAQHPERREARLVAAVLREGGCACVLRLRGTAAHPEEIVEHPELAPNLTDVLLRTLRD